MEPWAAAGRSSRSRSQLSRNIGLHLFLRLVEGMRVSMATCVFCSSGLLTHFWGSREEKRLFSFCAKSSGSFPAAQSSCLRASSQGLWLVGLPSISVGPQEKTVECDILIPLRIHWQWVKFISFTRGRQPSWNPGTARLVLVAAQSCAGGQCGGSQPVPVPGGDPEHTPWVSLWVLMGWN